MEAKDKMTIWFLGGNATGKTTQCAKLHLLMREIAGEPNFKPIVYEFDEDGIKYSYTKVSPISANLGVFNHPLTTTDGSKTNACCGTDKLSTKAQIVAAYVAAVSDPDVKIITVDAIMATGQFIEFLSNDETELVTVLLDCSEDINFMRLAQRRAVKLGVDPSEVILSEKTRENLSRKLGNFRRTYAKATEVSDAFDSISTDNLSIDDVFKRVLNCLQDC